MLQVQERKRLRSQINKKDLLLNEMNRRKNACLSKMQKLSDRINILERFKNDTSGRDITLKDYLKLKGLNYKDFIVPMGYFTPNGFVVSDDAENKHLTYHKGMEYNQNTGYYTPIRSVVSDKDHNEITSSIFGMTWNPALMHYYPTTVFDTSAYTSAEEIGDSGIDMVGGLKTEDFGKLNNKNEDAQEMVSMVQDLLQEEFDNVEDELDLIQNSQMKLSGYESFEGEDTRKAQSGKNLACRTACASKHPFNKSKRNKCNEDCDKKFKPSQKQQDRREERKERQEARKEFREDKKDCKEKFKRGEINKSQLQDCIKKERKEKRAEIKDAGGNLLGRTWRATAKVNPVLLASRGSVLALLDMNAFGFSTRLAPALLPDDKSKELFKPDAIIKAKKGWEKVSRAWKNLGGDPNKLKSNALKGYNKKPLKVARKSSFEGEDYYEFEEQSNFVDPVTLTTIITTGLSTLAGLITTFSKAGGEKNPYKPEKTPDDFKTGLEEGAVENPEIPENSPTVNEKGEWIEQSTGKVIDPVTGKYKDNILGMNKWVAIGLGVVALAGVIYLIKGKK